jgi:hypothetical protein
MDHPFEIVVYDADFEVIGFVVDPIYENFVPSWDNQGYGNFMLTADNPHTEALQEDGARVTVTYRGKQLLSGPVMSWQGDVLDDGTVTYQVLDDRAILEDTVLFVNPDQPLMPTSNTGLGQAWAEGPLTAGTVKNQDGYYRWPAGITTPEGAIKHVIRDQLVERLGRPLTIMPDQGRGGTLDYDDLPRIRWDPVSESLTPLLNKHDLGVRVWQEPFTKGLRFDVVERGTWDEPLTVESGIIVSGSFQIRRPITTRPIMGGNGETAARSFYGIEGSGYQTDDERRFGMIIETFHDATNGEITWPEGLAEEFKVAKYAPFVLEQADWLRYQKTMRTAHERYLADGGTNVSLALRLAETETFHALGVDGIQVGDRVIAVIRGRELADTVTEVQLTFTRDNGLVVEPIIGQYEDDPDRQLAQYVTDISKAVRRTNARR